MVKTNQQFDCRIGERPPVHIRSYSTSSVVERSVLTRLLLSLIVRPAEPFRSAQHKQIGTQKMTLAVSLRTLFLRLGYVGQTWIEVRSWTGWKVQRESGKYGGTCWWMWFEVTY